MFLRLFPKAAPGGDVPDPYRASFENLTDDEIIALRERYKRYERAIFMWSHENVSIKRIQQTAGAFVMALREATKTKDKQVVFCPWIFEAFHTLSEQIASPLDLKPADLSIKEWNEERGKSVLSVCRAIQYMAEALVNYVNAVFPDGESSPKGFVEKLRKTLAAYFKPDLFADPKSFADVLFVTFYGVNNYGVVYFNNEPFLALMSDCLTQAWPNCVALNDPDAITITNLTSEMEEDVMCDYVLPFLRPKKEDISLREEQDEADLREIRDSIKQHASTSRLLRAPGIVSAAWCIVESAYSIAQKAHDFREYYQGNALEAPSRPLSADLASQGDGSLFRTISDFERDHLEYVHAFEHSESSYRFLGDVGRPLALAFWTLAYNLNRLSTDASVDRFCIKLFVLKATLDTLLMTCQTNEQLTARLSASTVSIKDALRNVSAVLLKIEEDNAVRNRNPTKRAPSLFHVSLDETATKEKPKGSADIMQALLKNSNEYYLNFGADTTKWPRQYLVVGVIHELCWVVSASEILKERLAGNEVDDGSGRPNLAQLLKPQTSLFLPIFKRVAETFEDLNQGEYIEPLFGNLLVAGCVSHFYLELSTSKEGLRILAEYKDFWMETFDSLFCSPETKIKPKTTREEAMAAYQRLEDICRRLSIEAEIQQAEADRRVFLPQQKTLTVDVVRQIAAEQTAEIKEGNEKSRKKLEKKLKAPRLELTQVDVANDLGVSRKTVNEWETNQTVDGPDNKSNKFGYYKSLRTNPDLRSVYNELVQIVQMYKKSAKDAKLNGRRSITFVAFNEKYHSMKAKSLNPSQV